MTHKKYRPWKSIAPETDPSSDSIARQDPYSSIALLRSPADANTTQSGGSVLLGGIAFNNALSQPSTPVSNRTHKITEHAKIILAEIEENSQRVEEALAVSKTESEKIRKAYEEKVQQTLNKLNKVEQARELETKARKVAEHKTKYILEQIGIAEHGRIEALEGKKRLEQALKEVQAHNQRLLKEETALKEEQFQLSEALKHQSNQNQSLDEILQSRNEEIENLKKNRESMQANLEDRQEALLVELSAVTEQLEFQNQEISTLKFEIGKRELEIKKLMDKNNLLFDERTNFQENNNLLIMSNEFLEAEQNKLNQKLKQALEQVKNLSFDLKDQGVLKKELDLLTEQFSQLSLQYNKDKIKLDQLELEAQRLSPFEKECTSIKHHYGLLKQENTEFEQELNVLRKEAAKRQVAESIALDSLEKVEQLEKIIASEQEVRHAMEERFNVLQLQLQEAQMARQLEENMRRIFEKKAEETVSQTGKAFLQLLNSQHT